MAAFRRHRSLATALALAYAAVILYASLYPFGTWRWPPGQTLPMLARLPWLPWGDAFDGWSNVLGYLPLGLLAMIAALRSGWRHRTALVLALLGPALLSFALEVTQSFVPTRHPSAKDWAANSAGAAAGALLAVLLHRIGWVDRMHALRERWFARDGTTALVLLALWPLALMFPAPVPLGLGQFDGRVREHLAAWLEDVPWAEPVHTMLVTQAANLPPLSPFAEGAITMLGMLAPCLLAYTIVAPGWQRLALAFGAVVCAAAAMTLSTLLNFGPRHATAWITPWAGPGVGAAAIVALLLAPSRRSLVLGVALMVFTGLVIGVAQAPPDPYFAQNLQSWEQGRFVRFHGAAQWLGWLWPYAGIAWLLSRLAART